MDPDGTEDLFPGSKQEHAPVVAPVVPATTNTGQMAGTTPSASGAAQAIGGQVVSQATGGLNVGGTNTIAPPQVTPAANSGSVSTAGGAQVTATPISGQTGEVATDGTTPASIMSNHAMLLSSIATASPKLSTVKSVKDDEGGCLLNGRRRRRHISSLLSVLCYGELLWWCFRTRCTLLRKILWISRSL